MPPQPLRPPSQQLFCEEEEGCVWVPQALADAVARVVLAAAHEKAAHRGLGVWKHDVHAVAMFFETGALVLRERPWEPCCWGRVGSASE